MYLSGVHNQENKAKHIEATDFFTGFGGVEVPYRANVPQRITLPVRGAGRLAHFPLRSDPFHGDSTGSVHSTAVSEYKTPGETHG